MMRCIVCRAPVVCSVDISKWPVSAALMAIPIVSRSRISPTSITSGSARIAWRRAIVKSGVSLPTSRWLTTHFFVS